MERIRLELLRKDLGKWMSQAVKRRFVVTRRGYDLAGVCSPEEVKLLERLEESGALEDLRREVSG